MPSRSTSNPCVRFSSPRFLAMQLPMAAWFIETPPVLRTAQACDKSRGRGIPVGRIQGNMGPSGSFRHRCMELRRARTTHPTKTYVEHAATLPARSCFKQRNPRTIPTRVKYATASPGESPRRARNDSRRGRACPYTTIRHAILASDDVRGICGKKAPSHISDGAVPSRASTRSGFRTTGLFLRLRTGTEGCLVKNQRV